MEDLRAQLAAAQTAAAGAEARAARWERSAAELDLANRRASEAEARAKGLQDVVSAFEAEQERLQGVIVVLRTLAQATSDELASTQVVTASLSERLQVVEVEKSSSELAFKSLEAQLAG